MVKFGAYAFAHDPEIAAAARHHLARIYRYVALQAQRDGSEHPHHEAVKFVGQGFFIYGAIAAGLESVLTPEEWAAVCGGKTGVARVEDRLAEVA
jgi:hypothetical protein